MKGNFFVPEFQVRQGGSQGTCLERCTQKAPTPDNPSKYRSQLKITNYKAWKVLALNVFKLEIRLWI